MRVLRRGIGVAALALALAGCGSGDGPPPAPTPVAVSGPLCDALPAGDDPGAPATLADDPADVALQWIPVLTTFEAAVRATGIAGELDDVTILAPTDDAFAAAFDRGRLDELLLKDHDDLRALLEAHIVEGQRSLADLLEDGRATTLAGGEIEAAPADGMARLDGRATTVCADYAAANARIHVIDAVLR
jgi:uncharacterized surface protein with fasciclin (FAS1) repeats